MTNMKQPKSAGLTMKQLMAHRKEAKNIIEKTYWSGRIDGLKNRAEYKEWLKKNK